MSRYSGPQSSEPKAKGQRNKGIARKVRALKRQQAEERNAVTPYWRTRQYRLALAANQENMTWRGEDLVVSLLNEVVVYDDLVGVFGEQVVHDYLT